MRSKATRLLTPFPSLLPWLLTIPPHCHFKASFYHSISHSTSYSIKSHTSFHTTTDPSSSRYLVHTPSTCLPLKHTTPHILRAPTRSRCHRSRATTVRRSTITVAYHCRRQRAQPVLPPPESPLTNHQPHLATMPAARVITNQRTEPPA